ncbi:hypothetical protein ACHAXA_001942, partial [Cyclostephanos tholiformis]
CAAPACCDVPAVEYFRGPRGGTWGGGDPLSKPDDYSPPHTHRTTRQRPAMASSITAMLTLVPRRTSVVNGGCIIASQSLTMITWSCHPVLAVEYAAKTARRSSHTRGDGSSSWYGGRRDHHPRRQRSSHDAMPDFRYIPAKNESRSSSTIRRWFSSKFVMVDHSAAYRDAMASSHGSERLALRAGYPAGGKFAVIRLAGFQHKVTVDDLLVVNKLKPVSAWSVGSTHTVKDQDVLLIADQNMTLVGMPSIKGGEVDVMVEEITRDKTLVVFKKRRRKNSRRKNGFRRHVTFLRVLDVRMPSEVTKKFEVVDVVNEDVRIAAKQLHWIASHES